MNNILKTVATTIVILIIIATMIGTASTTPTIEWNKKFDGSACYDHWARSVQQTMDRGFILTIYSRPYCMPDYISSKNTDMEDINGIYGIEYWILKTNKFGNETWRKDLEGNTGEIRQTSDGGYIIAENDYEDAICGIEHILLIKINSNGNKLWKKKFCGFAGHGTYHDISIRQTTDGGYILSGSIYDSDKRTAYLIKTDENGNKLWIKTFAKSEIRSVWQTLDNGYISTGTTENDFLLIKTDENGNKLWSNKYGGGNVDDARFAQQTLDKGYIIIGDTNSYGAGDFDIWIIKTDSNGNKLWDKTFGGPYYEFAGSVQQTKNGNYIIAGTTYSYGESGDGWIIKTDANGNKLWNMTLGGNSPDSIHSVQQTVDGGYIAVGGFWPYDNHVLAWLVKLSSDESINLLKNPGFETSDGIEPTYWDKYQTGSNAIFTYPEIGRGGTGKSVAIKYTTKETDKVALWRQDGIVVSPSKQYKLSGYMKLHDVTGSGAVPRPGGASIRVTWYKSDGSVIKTDLINKIGTSGWTRYEAIFTAPSNAVKATVAGDLFDSSGKVWFDDLSFVKIS